MLATINGLDFFLLVLAVLGWTAYLIERGSSRVTETEVIETPTPTKIVEGFTGSGRPTLGVIPIPDGACLERHCRLVADHPGPHMSTADMWLEERINPDHFRSRP